MMKVCMKGEGEEQGGRERSKEMWCRLFLLAEGRGRRQGGIGFLREECESCEEEEEKVKRMRWREGGEEDECRQGSSLSRTESFRGETICGGKA
jgi:hypothetical protein